MATTISAPFGTLPHYLQQRVLAGVLYHDHKATAAACKGFRAIIRGPGFLALRQRHGFAERVVVVVGNTHLAQGVRLVAVKPGQMTKDESLLSGVRPETRAPGCSFEEKRLTKLLGFVMDGKLVLVKHGNLLTYDPQSETWAESASYPSEGRYPPRMHHACVHNGRIIVFMENGSAFARAADGSWATYEGAAAVGPPVFGLLAPQHYASESVLLG